MRVPVLITALVVSVFVPSVSAVAQDPGMMAAQQAQMANQQAMQNAQLANQQAMQSAQQANAFSYGPQLLPEPKFSLKAGTYSVPQQLRLTSRARGATIYYTTDGWTPTTASPQYDGPITISATTHVQAIAVSPDGRSMVADAVFTLPGAVAPLPVAAVANPAGLLPAGTQVGLSFGASVDSQTAQVGDKVPLKLTTPILVDGKPVSPEEVTAQCTVVHVDRVAHVGRPGVLTVRVDWLRVDGVSIPLNAVKTLEGTNHFERSAGLAAIPLVGAFSLLQHGGPAVIPVGMPIVASVAADTSLRVMASGGSQ